MDFIKQILLYTCMLCVFVDGSVVPGTQFADEKLPSSEEGKDGENFIPTFDLQVLVKNLDRVRSKIFYRVYLPEEAEVEKFQFIQGNGSLREKRAISSEDISQTAEVRVGIEPGALGQYQLIYKLDPRPGIQSGEKQFHKLDSVIRVLSATQVQGEISTPNYPGDYPNGAAISWLIGLEGESVVSLTMDDFSVEECCDRIIIYDGKSTSATVLGMIAGITGNYSGTTTYTSTGSSMFIQFTSDCSVTSRGFRASFRSNATGTAQDTTQYPAHTTTIATNYTAVTGTAVTQISTIILTSGSGFIRSPSYPYQYPFNSENAWLISPYGNVSSITLSFGDFDTRAGIDFLYIYNGGSVYSSLLAVITGHRYPGYEITGTANQLFLRFSTGAWSYNQTNRGFNAAYAADYNNFNDTANSTACSAGIELSGNSGAISSPNFPSDYNSNSYCTWSIETYTGTRVQIIFSYFYLEPNYDYLTIYNGSPDHPGSMIARLTGFYSIPYTVYATSNQAYIVFTTDGSAQYNGFNLTYEGIYTSTTEPPVQCDNQTIESTGLGFVTSPNYPEYYGNNLQCEWLIITPIATRVHLTIVDFRTESSYDRLYIYDTNTANNVSILDVLSGSIDSGYNLVSSDNKVLLRFVTDGSVADRGFNISYQPMLGNFTNATDACSSNAMVVGQTGFIQSPNYPYDYPNNSDCTWNVRTPNQTTVRLTVFDFNTEYYFDYLDIYDGSTYIRIVRLQGYVSSGTTISSNSNEVIMQFHSDSIISMGGFRIQYDGIYAYNRTIENDLAKNEANSKILGEPNNRVNDPKRKIPAEYRKNP